MSPTLRLLNSTTSTVLSSLTIAAQSKDVWIGKIHSPLTLKYSGNTEVIWNPWGATPSFSTSPILTSGALIRTSCVKSGGVNFGNWKLIFKFPP